MAGCESVMVLLPMTRVPVAGRLIGVPAMVIPGLPGEIVVPANKIDAGLAVNTWSPTV